MRIKSLLGILYLIIQFSNAKGQVNPSNGSFSYNIPVVNFTDKVSALSLSLGLFYNSGNGLSVDETSSSIGTGWDLVGVPKIVRIQKGQPDDQIAYSGQNNNGVNIYPNGYLYNPNTNKCPTTLTGYPIFGGTGNGYAASNLTTADTELDNFVLDFGGKVIEFILDKKKFLLNGEKTVILTSDSKIKINFTTGFIADCRTSIDKFELTDENGIVYTFSNYELSKMYNYAQTTQGQIRQATEIPTVDNPYLVTSWYVTKIKDPQTNRQIDFEYNSKYLIYSAVNDLSVTFRNAPFTSGFNGFLPASAYELSRTKIKNFIISKEISRITLPNQQKIDFEYLNTQRKDLPESNQFATYALSNIFIKAFDNSRISRLSLTHSFFVKNQIKIPVSNEVYSSRLCLTKVQKFGIEDTDFEPASEFEYHIGSNSTEDFVPPYNYFAKDPWGYYNGDYCGIDPTQYDRDVLGYNFLTYDGTPNNCSPGNPPTCTPVLALQLSTYLALHGVIHPENLSHEIVTGVKTKYAQNGLLKTIKNPYGGLINIEYEQNTSPLQQWNRAPNINNIGGVHVSKVIQKNVNANEDVVNNYKFINPDGSPSSFGFEQPRFATKQYVSYSAEGKYFLPNASCSYHFLYPGTTKQSLAGKALGSKIGFAAFNYFVSYQGLLDLVNGFVDIEGFAYSYLIQYCLNAVISCAYTERPQSRDWHYTYSQMPINYRNKLPELFKRVEISSISSEGLANGKSVIELTSDQDFPFIVPQITTKLYNSYTDKIRFLPRLYGLTKKQSIYNNNNDLLSQVSSAYNSIISSNGDNDSKSCVCNIRKTYSIPDDEWRNYEANPSYLGEFNAENDNLEMYMEFYNIQKGRVELSNQTTNTYSLSSGQSSRTVNYSYSPLNYQQSNISSTDSKGKAIEIKNYYVEDYNLANSANSVLNSMKNANIISEPIATETWQTKPGSSPEMISSTVKEFGIVNNGFGQPMYKHINNYELQVDRPISQSLIGTFNPDKLIRNPAGQNLIVPSIEYTYNSYFGELVQNKNIQGNKSDAIIFATGNRIPVAIVQNAKQNEIAYTSFEIDGSQYTGNWSSIGGQILNEPSLTGKYCYQLQSGTLTPNNLAANSYTLSFWATSKNFIISSGIAPVISKPTINGWTYYEFSFPPNTTSFSITGSGNCKIDELRVYPKRSTMNTKVYDERGNVTSECDINNRVTYYEYDGMNRLSKILDEQRNIVKTYEYHFKN